MTRKEFIVIYSVLQDAYINGMPKEQRAINTWYEMLCDLDYDIAKNAVLQIIQNSTFPPKVADIRRACAEHTRKELLPAEAWEQVKRAIRMYGMYQEERAINSLDQDVAEVVKWFSWYTICTTEDGEQAIRARFMDSFNRLQERKKKEETSQPAIQQYKRQSIQMHEPEKVLEIAEEPKKELKNFNSKRVSDLIEKMADELGARA